MKIQVVVILTKTGYLISFKQMYIILANKKFFYLLKNIII